MSSMLEQAIIDADALKEAALKNAEQAVVEKYQLEVKEAVQSLLEQPLDELEEEPMADMGDLGGLPASEDDLARQIAPAHAEGEELCGCPEEEIEIDFNQLAAEMDAAEENAPDMPLPEEEEEMMLPEELDIDEDHLLGILEEITEELTVDMQSKPTGWLNAPTAEIEHAADMDVAKARELEEELEEKEKALEELSLDETKLREENKKLAEQNEKFKQMLVQAKDKLNEVNLSNARLFYTNRVLTSVSLNERQKTKIVESISSADTVEEAKTIFETLQSAVGSKSNKKAPKSLSEAVERKSSILPRRQEKKSHTFSDRMKILAGINN
jgi:hypothetical protein